MVDAVGRQIIESLSLNARTPLLKVKKIRRERGFIPRNFEVIAENINYRTFVFSASIAKCLCKSFIITALCYKKGNAYQQYKTEIGIIP